MKNKYELISATKGMESETDEDLNYSVVITLAIHPTDGIAPDFSKDIIVVNNNNQTGVEVDEYREKMIKEYIEKINS